MNLLNAKIYIEKVTDRTITNKQLADALNMYESGVSRKITTGTKLKPSQIKSLETYFCLELPNDITENNIKDKIDNYDKLEKIIIQIELFLKKTVLPIIITPERKAKLITTIYRMVQYNAVEVNDILIENLLRLMDE